MAAANVVDEEATRDGIECGVCLIEFDDGENKPKSLACGHIFCVRCIKLSLARRSSLIRCFVCSQSSKQPTGGADNLTTSNCTLQLIKLNRLLETYNSHLLKHSWCLICEKTAKPGCCKNGHIFSSLPVNSVPFLNKKITKVQVKLDNLKVQKQVVTVQIMENEELLKKLLNQLELAEKKLTKQSLPSSSSGASAEPTDTVDVTTSTVVDASNDSVQFSCRELATEWWSTVLGFTIDGSFLISGDLGGSVNLWPLNREQFPPRCVTMKTKEKRSAITCLAVSPDNGRIFSGVLGKTIDIHDTRTTELLCSVSNLTLISNRFSLQPETDGQILAALSIVNGVVLLFDLRTSFTEPVMRAVHSPLISQRSITFSPVDNSFVALIGEVGSHFLDLRRPAEFLRTYPQAGTSISFNSIGTRLLCFERGQQPAVYDLSTTAEQQRPSTKFELTATGKSIVSAFSCSTFGDIHGNVLVAGSDDGNVYSWCEDNKQQSQKRLKIFPVNKNHPIRSVCYYNSTIGKPILAACSDNIVKLWSPSLVQPLLPSRSL